MQDWHINPGCRCFLNAHRIRINSPFFCGQLLKDSLHKWVSMSRLPWVFIATSKCSVVTIETIKLALFPCGAAIKSKHSLRVANFWLPSSSLRPTNFHTADCDPICSTRTVGLHFVLAMGTLGVRGFFPKMKEIWLNRQHFEMSSLWVWLEIAGWMVQPKLAGPLACFLL